MGRSDLRIVIFVSTGRRKSLIFLPKNPRNPDF